MFDVIQIVLPVFLVVALGYLLRVRGLVSPAVNSGFSWLVFYVAAPALLFRGAATASLSSALDLSLIGSVYGVSLLFALIVMTAGFRIDPARRGVVAQGSFRSNLVFVGLPVLASAMGTGSEVMGPVSLLIGFTVPLYNFLAVVVLTCCRSDRGEGRGIPRDRLRDVLFNPLILASVAGILYSATGLPLPTAADRTLQLVGGVASPLALIAVGVSLDLSRLRSEALSALSVSTVKLLLYPALLYGILTLLDVDPVRVEAAVILTSAPTAVASHIMAMELEGDEKLAASVVVSSTLLALLTMSGWLMLFRGVL